MYWFVSLNSNCVWYKHENPCQCIQFPAFIMKEENEICHWIKTCLSRSTNHKCIGFLSLIHLDGENLCLKWIWIHIYQCNAMYWVSIIHYERGKRIRACIFSVSIIGRKYIFEYRKRNINENAKKKYNWKGRWRNVVVAYVLILWTWNYTIRYL